MIRYIMYHLIGRKWLLWRAWYQQDPFWSLKISSSIILSVLRFSIFSLLPCRSFVALFPLISYYVFDRFWSCENQTPNFLSPEELHVDSEMVSTSFISISSTSETVYLNALIVLIHQLEVFDLSSMAVGNLFWVEILILCTSLIIRFAVRLG